MWKWNDDGCGNVETTKPPKLFKCIYFTISSTSD